MLFEVDGLSKAWSRGVPSFWESDQQMFGDHDIPDSIRRLVDPAGAETWRLYAFDHSRFGYQPPPPTCKEYDAGGGSPEIPQSPPAAAGTIQSGIAVNELGFFQFRSMLIDNFNIIFHEQKVYWPSRLAQEKPRGVPTNLVG